MSDKRRIEIFTAGCPACDDTVAMINQMVCPCCDVSILDMHEKEVASRARALGIRSLPAVAVDGQLADCCIGRGPDEGSVRAMGVGQPL